MHLDLKRVVAARRFGRGLGAYAANGFVPELVADFSTGRYWSDSDATDPLTLFAETSFRSGTATYFDSAGVMQTAADGEVRIRHTDPETGVSGVLIETESRTNVANYSKMNDFSLQSTSQTLGATTVEAGSQGITAEVVATGVERGIPYLDWRISGTENGTGTEFINIFNNCNLAASPGDMHATSIYLSLVGGTIPSDNYLQVFQHYRDASTLLSAPVTEIGSDITSTLKRYSVVSTAPASTTELDRGGVYARIPASASVDFTIRVGALQIEAITAANPYPSTYISTSGSTGTRNADGVLTIASSLMPSYGTAFSVAVQGQVSFGDNDQFANGYFYRWQEDTSNYAYAALRTSEGSGVGRLNFWQAESGTADSSKPGVDITPGPSVGFSVACRHGSTFIQGAQDGTAASADVTPTALADLSAIDFEIGFEFNGVISRFVVWAEDIEQAGVEAASLDPFG
jgi:hypothetical protein